jgi:hypothetical protein
LQIAESATSARWWLSFVPDHVWPGLRLHIWLLDFDKIMALSFLGRILNA